MSDLHENIKLAVDVINNKVKVKPDIAIILGTGLGALANEIKNKVSIPYGEIPHFPISTVETHAGKLVFGKIGDKKVVAMQGRFHIYEGYDMKQITFPVRVMRALGTKYLIVSNAAGGLNPQYTPGDLMIISDHISLLMWDNPLIGHNDEKLGPRYPDMCEPYSKELLKLAEKIAIENKIKYHKGVYVGVTGPSLETAAEYRFLRLIGADAVGMSTVPEVVVAVHCGLKVLGISVITDECLPDCLKPADITSIIKTAETAEPKLTLLMNKVIQHIKV
ncbi:MAG: purine-nucleoside phosphorylase [Candidatus Firestonebacteria bacterium]